MIVLDVGCLLIDNNRSKAYIQKLLLNNFVPEQIFFLNIEKRKKETKNFYDDLFSEINKFNINRKYFYYEITEKAINPLVNFVPRNYLSFNVLEKPCETLDKYGIKYTVLNIDSLDDEILINEIEKSQVNYFIFSGGGILKKDILSLGKNFIHIHPALLPDIRGSMGIEWSVLLKNECSASAIFMSEEIDMGKIIKTKHFDYPVLEGNNVSPLFCSHIRSELLLEIVKEFVENGNFPLFGNNIKDKGRSYYKMHPLLNNIVFYKCLKNRTTGA